MYVRTRLVRSYEPEAQRKSRASFWRGLRSLLRPAAAVLEIKVGL